MKVSVVIAAYNEAENISKVLGVLKRALKKSIIQEIIVIDDGSSDDTADVSSSFGVKIIRFEKNRGKGAALQAGISAAKGEIIVLLDADLLNFSTSLLTSMIDPVRNNTKIITIGKFAGRDLRAVWGNAITSISGQRAFHRNLVEKFPDFENVRFGVDYLITKTAEKHKYRIKIVKLRGVKQKYAEEKIGVLRGLNKRLKMYLEIFRTMTNSNY